MSRIQILRKTLAESRSGMVRVLMRRTLTCADFASPNRRFRSGPTPLSNGSRANTLGISRSHRQTLSILVTLTLDELRHHFDTTQMICPRLATSNSSSFANPAVANHSRLLPFRSARHASSDRTRLGRREELIVEQPQQSLQEMICDHPRSPKRTHRCPAVLVRRTDCSQRPEARRGKATQTRTGVSSGNIFGSPTALGATHISAFPG